jgi:2-polyprenyl-3-methyl-5-hydroxy-6-metoxy-1,4-benzoquinol methylase
MSSFFIKKSRCASLQFYCKVTKPLKEKPIFTGFSMDRSFDPGKYWEDRLSKTGGLKGVGFKKLGPSFNSWAYRVRRHVFTAEVRRLDLDLTKAKVLDIGSGTGVYIDLWRKFGARDITGLDITNVAVKQLSSLFPENKFFVGDISDPSFKQHAAFAQYDVISAMDVLFHIVDDERYKTAVENIAAALKPGGYFIYSDSFMKDQTIRGESHVARTEEFIMSVISEKGFEKIRLRPFMYLFDNPADTKNPLLKSYWFLLHNGLYALPFMGNVLGPLLYPLEMLLLRTAKRGPSSKFSIFRKR